MFKVIEVLSYNTIRISPSWKTDKKSGNIIKIRDLEMPEDFIRKYKMEEIAIQNFYLCRTKKLLLGSIVNLYNSLDSENNLLQCDVYLNEVSITNYYPEFREVKKPQYFIWIEKIKKLLSSYKKVNNGNIRHNEERKLRQV